MKYLFAIAFLSIINISFAGDYNSKVNSGEITLTTKVIVPMLIEMNQALNPSQYPTVLKGESRDLKPDEIVMAIHVKKDTSSDVNFHVDVGSNPVNGVKLEGTWIFNQGSNEPGMNNNNPVIPKSGDIIWNSVSCNNGWLYLRLDRIDASRATGNGTASFIAAMTGEYTGI